jgi:hypothetical protein
VTKYLIEHSGAINQGVSSVWTNDRCCKHIVITIDTSDHPSACLDRVIILSLHWKHPDAPHFLESKDCGIPVSTVAIVTRCVTVEVNANVIDALFLVDSAARIEQTGSMDRQRQSGGAGNRHSIGSKLLAKHL